MSPLPKTLVIGASGYIGKATLSSLVSRHGIRAQIHAGVRNPSTFGEMEGVTVVKADMGDKKALVKTLKDGYDSIFLVIPGHIDRTQLGMNGLEAAKEAGVKHVLLLSVLTAETDTIFGRQFKPLEDKVKQLGISHTIIRLPLFMDNNYAHVGSIQQQGTFYVPQDPTKMHTPVAVGDVGKAAADILVTPRKHNNKLYKLVSPGFTLNDQAAAFTKALKKKVTVTVVPYDAAKQAFMGMGFPEWQTDGILELYKSIDSGSSVTNEIKDTNDIEKITGEKATTVEEWCNQNASGFAMPPLPKVLVLGASGYIGKATLSSLVSRHGSQVQIHAGVRDPSKFGEMEGVTVVKADMGDKKALVKTLKDGYDSIFLVIPGHIDRTQLGMNGLEAAKEAGVKHVLLLSVLTAETDTIFGRQFKPLEDKVKQLGISHTIIRLPLFMDNNYAHVGSIQQQGTFYVPQDPTKMHTPVAVGDVGKAASDILAAPQDHHGKLYKLVSPGFTLNDQAAAFTKALKKKVTVTVVPYDAAKQAFMGMGFPEWQTDGILELYKSIDSGSSITNVTTNSNDIEKITGEKATTVEEWCKQNAPGFWISVEV